MTARTLLGDWLAEYPLPQTRRAYERDVEVFFAWCLEHDVDPLEPGREEVSAYRNELVDSELAPSTVDRKLSACRSYYSFCVEAKAIDASPFAFIRRTHQPGESTTPWLSAPELKLLLEAAEKVDPTGRDLVLVSLLGLNGLRISEALAADVRDLGISGGHRVLQVNRKGTKAGVVPLAPQLVAVLDRYLDGRTSGPLIVRRHRHGGLIVPAVGISREAAHRRVRRLAELAGVNEAIGNHSLRHSFVTLSLEAGAPLHIVQGAVGHKDPATTQRYNRERHTLEGSPTFGLTDHLLGEG